MLNSVLWSINIVNKAKTLTSNLSYKCYGIRSKIWTIGVHQANKLSKSIQIVWTFEEDGTLEWNSEGRRRKGKPQEDGRLE